MELPSSFKSASRLAVPRRGASEPLCGATAAAAAQHFLGIQLKNMGARARAALPRSHCIAV